MKKRHLLGALALGTTAALALAGCGSNDSDGSGDDSASKEITIGVFNGWPEGEAASYLWKLALEDKGYTVDLEYADAGPVFAGVDKGDYDIALDGWLPFTHKDYFEQNDVDDVGAWNEDAKLTIAVNADAPIDSLEELAENADLFGNRIIGIEPGAGLTKATQENTIPEYGLEDMDFVTSSTPAMLAELSSKLDAGEDVVVTLWRPHWAYDAFDIKDLEDPEETLGAAESIHTIARTDFVDDFPEVHAWLADFEMDSELLFSLENAMYNSGAEDVTDYTDIVRAWMDENSEYVAGLTD